MDRRIQAAVVKAVADAEARYTEKSRVQLAEFHDAAEGARKRLILAEVEFDKARARAQVIRTANMNRPDDAGGEPR
jgi:hypothetical protein